MEERESEFYKNKQKIKDDVQTYAENIDFISYMNFLDLCKKEIGLETEAIIGGIVINANPFTLGHSYLVELASKMVDFLYVFVVEEDRSDFSFKVRYDLVVKGTQELKNVKVIPSGKFIISNITFPEYFDKNNDTRVAIIPSLDIEIFGMFIAKKLGISIRFVGEEKEDFVTSQYNNYMREKLPFYGIKVIEIPRLKKNGEIISASKVRKLISSGELKKIKDLVPLTTYRYFENRI